jgi:hypothetical protein
VEGLPVEPAPREIAGIVLARGHLDDGGPEIGELAHARRPRSRPGEVDDGERGEWALPGLRSHVSTTETHPEPGAAVPPGPERPPRSEAPQ